MSNLVPKLNIFNFFKFHKSNNKIDSFITKKRDNFIIGFLSQSCWSLSLIALWRRKIFQKTKVNVLIPEYFCNTALTPLRKMGFNILFYKLNDDLFPDKIYLEELAKKNELDLFLIVNFFGIEKDYSFIKDFCKNNNCWLIKDSAHSLNEKEISDDVDFTFFSPHKILPYPMGSILSINSNGPAKLNYKDYQFIKMTDSWYLQINDELQKKNLKTKINILFSIIWFVKRLFQSLNLKINLNKKINFKDDLSINKISSFLNPKIDFFSKFIIKFNKINYFKEIESRIRLSLVLENTLNNLDNKIYGEIIYLNKIDIYSNKLPYFAVIETSKANKLYEYFQKNNIDCITWPDQPPEVINSKLKTSVKLRQSRVFVPLFNIRMHKDLIKLNKKNIIKNDDFEIEWEKVKKSDWDKNFKLISQNNLLQSWDYGEFKNKFEKFEIFRGIILDSEKKIIGLVQILSRSFLGLHIIRLNRGPLFIKNNEVLSNKVIRKIKNSFKKKRTFLMSFAPELNFNSNNIISFDNKIFKSPSWTSSKIYLSGDLSTIHSNLKKEWRKDLKKSLNSTYLQIEISSEKNQLKSVINHYNEESRKKGFKSINTKLLEFLNENSKLLTFVCKYNNEYMGSLSIAEHYPSATCLINPILEKGRKLKINHLLLWKAIEHLKQKNYSFLDTGGIDLEKSPGPANFKLGLNAQIYKLIGQKIYY
tara:strand:+ start:952 stop:3060 length:2109 start_codon:yes stop_codon:yes gene_type:complete